MLLVMISNYLVKKLWKYMWIIAKDREGKLPPTVYSYIDYNIKKVPQSKFEINNPSKKIIKYMIWFSMKSKDKEECKRFLKYSSLYNMIQNINKVFVALIIVCIIIIIFWGFSTNGSKS